MTKIVEREEIVEPDFGLHPKFLKFEQGRATKVTFTQFRTAKVFRESNSESEICWRAIVLKIDDDNVERNDMLISRSGKAFRKKMNELLTGRPSGGIYSVVITQIGENYEAKYAVTDFSVITEAGADQSGDVI